MSTNRSIGEWFGNRSPKMPILVLASLLLTCLGAARATAKTTEAPRDDYVLFQTVTFSDTNQQLTGYSTSGSLAVLKTPDGNKVDYELWTRGRVTQGSAQEQKESIHGPVRFSRNPTTETVSFSTKGFGLAEEVVNQVLDQVEKSPRMEGAWDQEISLILLGAHLPRKLGFHFAVQKIELKPGVTALCIRMYSDVFTIDVLPTAPSVDNGVFVGIYKGTLVYSPEDHRLYQMASEFDARKAGATLQIQETAFLAGMDGKPVHPLLDMREILGLKQQEKPSPMAWMSPWAVQALKVQQVVSIASITAAERASNPGPQMCLASEILQLDSVAGLFGRSLLDHLIENYAASYGDPAGQLAARFLGNLVLTGVGEAMPSALLLGETSPYFLTAVSVYSIYSTMAQRFRNEGWAGPVETGQSLISARLLAKRRTGGPVGSFSGALFGAQASLEGTSPPSPRRRVLLRVTTGRTIVRGLSRGI